MDQLVKKGLFNGFIDKGFQLPVLKEAITEVMEGEIYLSQELKKTLQRGRFYTLTSREREVIDLLVRGLTKKQIAYHLCLSPNTVDSHVRKLFKKLKMNTVQQITALHTLYINSRSEIPRGKLLE